MTVFVEHRARTERRLRYFGPPNRWLERRKNAERRFSAAEEAEPYPDELIKYFSTSIEIATTTDHQL